MSQIPTRCKAKKATRELGRASRPPARSLSSGLLALHAGELRAEAVLARSFFEKVSALLPSKSSH
jgi:hypothetical protein